MTAEQAKAESTQRGLEGERHALSLQVTMEREELERAKVGRVEQPRLLRPDPPPLPPPHLHCPTRVPCWRSRSR